MAGGGGRVSKGRMGSRLTEEVDPKILQEMDQKLQKVTQMCIFSQLTHIEVFHLSEDYEALLSVH